MNLVTCCEQCRYQIDGFCTRPGDAPASSLADECCYFEPLPFLNRPLPPL